MRLSKNLPQWPVNDPDMPELIARLILLTLCMACMVQAETRIFVSTAGTLLEAEIVSAVGENITLKRKEDSRVITVQRSTLCKEDHAFIDAWTTANPEQTKASPTVAATAVGGAKFSLSLTVRGSKETRSVVGSSYRTFDLTYKATVQSREVKRTITKAKGTIFTFGKNVDPRDDRLHVMQKIEFPIELAPQGKTEFTTPPVRLSYYNGGDSRDGAKDYGYMFIVTNEAGGIEAVSATPDSMEKFAKQALTLTAPCVIDRDFKAMVDVSIHSSITLNP